MDSGRRGRGPGRRKQDSPHPVDVHVGQRLRARRNVVGLSQEKLGEALGLTFQQVQKYERGANRVSASRLYEMGEVLGVSVPYFFEGLEQPEAGDLGSGFAEASAAPFESDPLAREETVDLIRAYYEVADPALRRRFLDLAKTLAATIEPPAKD